MCRFLMIRSVSPCRPEAVLNKFAAMARQSAAPDGDWQGDGWGIAWQAGNEEWNSYASLRPIWEEPRFFGAVAESTTYAVHARSASFAEQRNVLAYNQPFVNGHYAFVFNGLLRNVSMPFRVDGEIGSQKIWSLLLRFLERRNPAHALTTLADILRVRSRHVHALNLGLITGNRMFAFCNYALNPEYYQLHVHRSNGTTMICSEPLDGYSFGPLPVNQVVEL